MPSAPRVFISYSHDSDAHKERVLALANRLRDDGVDVRLDQYEPSPKEGWPRWTRRASSPRTWRRRTSAAPSWRARARRAPALHRVARFKSPAALRDWLARWRLPPPDETDKAAVARFIDVRDGLLRRRGDRRAYPAPS